jgi:DNA-binding transcriptional LysR family regulator
MVPTPRALAMRDQVRDAVSAAAAVFARPEPVQPAELTATFSLQIGDGLVSTIASRLLARVRQEAPLVRLRFVAESHEDTQSLRAGTVDLELGQIGPAEPEVRVEQLVAEEWIGVVRAGHRLTRGRVSMKRFAAADHVAFSRRGRMRGPVDDVLAEHGLTRRVVACAPSPAGGLFLVKNSDLVGMMPAGIGRSAVDALQLATFVIPLSLPPLIIGMAWHPRNDADGAQQWLRQLVREEATS